MTQKILQSVVIKPIGSFCNLQCEYCFYLDKHHLYEGPPSTHRMTDETLEKLIKDMFVCSNTPTFVWQGGEPTVMGLAFFQKVVATQQLHAKGKSYSNALQTHGMLLNEAWADFLRRENFLVGISLDGPEHLHDHYRKDRQGKGTFQQVFKNTQMLLNKGVPVNILATVNDYSVKYPREIYEFFVENGFFFMQFSPLVEHDPQNPKIAAPYSINARDYGRFLTQLFKCWCNDFDFERLKQKTSIRFFDSLMQRYIGMTPGHCALHKECNDYLVIEHNGDLFSCDFLVSNKTRIGNLHQISLKDAFYSPAHIAFGKRKTAYGTECQRCQWLHLCYGGCIKDRIRDPRDKGHNHFCESYKIFFKRADSRLKKFAKLYRQYYQD
jgi:uncharacterized protein